MKILTKYQKMISQCCGVSIDDDYGDFMCNKCLKMTSPIPLIQDIKPESKTAEQN